MKFSIVVPIYKVEKYLHECVDSILCQSFTDFELILVDDGSPDSCPQICDDYARKDPRVKVIHKPNGGQADARNVGTDIAQGDYIGYVDSDDYLIDSDVLQRLAVRIDKTNPDIVHYKFVEWYEIDGHIDPCYFDYKVDTAGRSLADIYCDLIDKDAYYNSAWSKVIRRQLLVDNNIRFEKGILGEDNEWYYHVVMVADRLELIDEPLYVYRQRQGSTTKDFSVKNLRDQLHVLSKWEAILAKREEDKRSRVVWNSLAKQYCSAIIIYAGLKQVNSFYPELKRMAYMLNASHNKRVVIFRRLRGLFGLLGLIAALRLIRLVKKN